jgi:pSer/pThr/pTyr-binding forkhead associated (FHA) protein
MARFLLEFQGAVLREIPANAEITVGRKPDNDVVIDNPMVSNYHCKIIPVGNSLFVEDLNSTNGVFVNTKKVTQAQLQNDDVIVVGKHVLKLVDYPTQVDDGTMTALPPSVDGTMMISPKRQEKLAAAAANAAKRRSIIRVMKGVVDQFEYELKNNSTYIGTSDRVQIRIQGTGIFGSAPENAAMIAHHRDSFFLLPVKQGYVKLNGSPLNQKEQLQDGDIIEAGGTTLKFENQSTD